MRVNFILGGTQKGGTTALDAVLRWHPGICMARDKEVHFFDKERYFRWRPRYRAYHAFFEEGKKDVLYGESTPIYLYWYQAPRRIWEYNSGMRLIFLLRNPIERAYSQWNMQRSRGWDDLPFGEAIRRERERCRAALPLQHRRHSYVDRGFYAEQLRRYLHFFPREQILVLRSEAFRADSKAVLDRIARFLGVSSFPEAEAPEVHVGQYASPMAEEDREYLRDLYEPSIRDLEKLLDWDCSDWLT